MTRPLVTNKKLPPPPGTGRRGPTDSNVNSVACHACKADPIPGRRTRSRVGRMAGGECHIDDWTLGANHVSRAPESGWPIPLLVTSGLATGPPAGVGDGLRFLSRRCQHICPRSGRFVCLNSAFSRHFWTFYGPSVQAMDAQLKALPTLPVRARTVSGCVNSANLNISQHFTVHLFNLSIPNSACGKGVDPGGS